MSMFEQTRKPEPKAPSLIAWHVSQKGERTIGTASVHRGTIVTSEA